MEQIKQINNKRKKTLIFWLFLCLLLALLLSNVTSTYFAKVFSGFLTILTPILLGVFIAFILKRLLDWFQFVLLKNCFKKMQNSFYLKRIISLSIIFFLLFAILTALFVIVIPNIARFINDLVIDLNGERNIITQLATKLNEFVQQFSWFNDVDIQQAVYETIDSFVDSIGTYLPILLQNALNIISQTSIYLAYFVIGITISFLTLKDKEAIGQYFKRVTYAFLNESRANYLCKVAEKSYVIMYEYFKCKSLEALVIFVIFTPIFLLLGVPFYFPLAITLAILNFIPYIGGIIAMVPIVLICIIFSSFNVALYAIISVIVGLTFIGAFITPNIFGRKLKVKSIIILLGILIGGAMFGFWGMLFAPPIIAIVCMLFNDSVVKKEKQKEIEINEFNDVVNKYDKEMTKEILLKAVEIVENKKAHQ